METIPALAPYGWCTKHSDFHHCPAVYVCRHGRTADCHDCQTEPGGTMSRQTTDLVLSACRMLDRLDDLADHEDSHEYLYLRETLFDFVAQHPEIARIVRKSGYPV